MDLLCRILPCCRWPRTNPICCAASFLHACRACSNNKNSEILNFRIQNFRIQFRKALKIRVFKFFFFLKFCVLEFRISEFLWLLLHASGSPRLRAHPELEQISQRRCQRTRVFHQLVGCRRALSTSSSLSGSHFNASVSNDMSSRAVLRWRSNVQPCVVEHSMDLAITDFASRWNLS